MLVSDWMKAIRSGFLELSTREESITTLPAHMSTFSFFVNVDLVFCPPLSPSSRHVSQATGKSFSGQWQPAENQLPAYWRLCKTHGNKEKKPSTVPIYSAGESLHISRLFFFFFIFIKKNIFIINNAS